MLVLYLDVPRITMPYLADEVEVDSVPGLGSDRVWSECELIISSNSDLHCCGRSSQALGQNCVDDGSEQHNEVDLI